MIAAQIGAALKARLTSLTFNPVIPIGWPNRNFTPSGKHLVAAIARTPNDRTTLKGRARFNGTLVVTVVTEQANGSGEGDGIADAVAAHFPADLILTLSGGSRLRVTVAPSVREGFADQGYWRTPVTVPFEVLN